MKIRLSNLIILVIAIVMCLPVFFLISGSFMSYTEVRSNLEPILISGGDRYVTWSLLPKDPSIRSYIELLMDTPEFFTAFWNSVYSTFGIILLQSLVAIPAAWCFAKLQIPCKKALLFVYILLMLLPFQVRMLSEYFVLNKIGILDTIWAMILPSGFSTFPVFIMYNFFKSVPDEVLEAAKIDGANDFLIFRKMGIPIGLHGIISALVLGFFEYWNLLEQPMTFLKDKTLWPLSLFVPNINPNNVYMVIVSALFALIPSLMIFLLGQEYLEQGIVSSGIRRNDESENNKTT